MMNEPVITTLVTESIFSEEKRKRYLMRKTWDMDKPSISVIMLAPSSQSGIDCDSTTMYVLNNAVRLGYGRVSLLNLFAEIDDFKLRTVSDNDDDNLEVIINECSKSDVIVYCAGVGKSQNKTFQKRQKDVLTSLYPHWSKVRCLCNASGEARLQHPLSPAVRTWFLSAFSLEELGIEDVNSKKTKK